MNAIDVISASQRAYRALAPAIESSLCSRVWNNCSYFVSDAPGEVLETFIVSASIHSEFEYATRGKLNDFKAKFDLVGSIAFEAEVSFFERNYDERDEWAIPLPPQQKTVDEFAIFQGKLIISFSASNPEGGTFEVNWHGPDKIGVAIGDRGEEESASAALHARTDGSGSAR